jgi:hypothetical protein
MGCDLGWFSNVGCSLKGSRGGKKGKIKNDKGFKFTRSIRKKKLFHFEAPPPQLGGCGQKDE